MNAAAAATTSTTRKPSGPRAKKGTVPTTALPSIEPPRSAKAQALIDKINAENQERGVVATYTFAPTPAQAAVAARKQVKEPVVPHPATVVTTREAMAVLGEKPTRKPKAEAVNLFAAQTSALATALQQAYDQGFNAGLIKGDTAGCDRATEALNAKHDRIIAEIHAAILPHVAVAAPKVTRRKKVV